MRLDDMLHRDHDVAYITCKVRKGCAPHTQGEDSQPRLTFIILKGKY